VETNALYFGDNLNVLRERLPDDSYRFPSGSVDLIYLDPPFNSNRDYNLIFKEVTGDLSEAQIKAFTDTWEWDTVARDTLQYLTVDGVNEGRIADNVGRLIDSMVRGIGHNDMAAYLVMMTPRLVELHRVLKDTGSLWLHCDATASHYLKILLDAIFGPKNYRNEVIWHYAKYQMRQMRKFVKNTDRLLFYVKSAEAPYVFNPQTVPLDKPKRYLRKQWSAELKRIVNTKDEAGRTIMDEYTDQRVDDVWDIPYIAAPSHERLGYPTQKPLRLLERIIAASSNPGDVVLDPFCGCGTALVAAQKMGRKWIGIDVTHLSIAVMRARLMDSFGIEDVPVRGLPEDMESARMLAAESKDGRYEFQWWAIGKIDAKPVGGVQKKGADRGIDGVMTFTERDSIERIIVSVKSGKPALGHVKELMATLTTEVGAIGVLIELNDPTPEMQRAAVEAGQYESELWGVKYDRIQILTVANLLDGKKPNVPKFLPGYQKATRIAADLGEQQALDLG
jgi:DNA modification methylase